MLKTTKYDYQKLLVSGFIRNFRNATPKDVVNLCLNFYNKCINIKGNSRILNDSLLYELDTILSSNINISTSMMDVLYGTSANHSRSLFHSKCDNKGPTITIYRNSNDYIFGGYTSKSWQSINKQFVTDTQAFLFVLYPHIKIFKIDPNCIDYAVYHNKSNGPCFGRNDIRINSRNHHSQSFCDNPTFLDITSEHIAGGQQWKILEYEVFKISDFNLKKLLQSKIEHDTWCNITDIEGLDCFSQSVLFDDKEYIIICNRFYWGLYDIENDEYMKYFWVNINSISKLNISSDTYCIDEINDILYVYSTKTNILITVNYKTKNIEQLNLNEQFKNQMYAKLVCIKGNPYLFLEKSTVSNQQSNTVILDISKIKNGDKETKQTINLSIHSASNIVYVANQDKLFMLQHSYYPKEYFIYHYDVKNGMESMDNKWEIYETKTRSIGQRIILGFDDILFFFNESCSHSIWCFDTLNYKLFKSEINILSGYSYLPKIINDKNNYLHFSEEIFDNKISLNGLRAKQLMEFKYKTTLINGYISEFQHEFQLSVYDDLKILISNFYPIFV